MNKILLHAFMKLFALIESIHKELNHLYTINYIEIFLQKEYNARTAKEYLSIYETYFKEFSAKNRGNETDLHQEIIQTTLEINKELPPQKRFLLIINILQLVKSFKVSDYKYPLSEGMSKTIGLIADQLMIPHQSYLNAEAFVLDSVHRIPNKRNLLLVSDVMLPIPDIKFVCRKGLDGQLFFLHEETANLYLFFYKGKSRLELNDKLINPRQLYIFSNSSSITGANIDPIYYNDIVRRYLYSRIHHKLSIHANEVSYKFNDKATGIHPFSFSAYSGQLIGIMGGSGVGKSTLINLLNGSLKPSGGSITLNGYNIYEEKKNLHDIIGYVSQNDFLIENLTVYENLYYSAKLSYGYMTETIIVQMVIAMLSELELYEIKDMRVGSTLDKIISGGERKRLNIALELIREPVLLFLDEPTSGLSSSDAEKIMHILQEYTLKGRLVIVNIHQPSSAIFRLFDQLILIDKGGYPVYVGNTMDALRYFKRHSNRIDSEITECKTCNNLYPEVLFQILEEKEIDDMGDAKNRRRYLPHQWYCLFQSELQKDEPHIDEREALPIRKVKAANKTQQYVIQNKRNIKSKIKDRQYVFLSILITPLLAFVLAFICRYLSESDNNTIRYIFEKNENIPSYIFMSVIVALFVGLIMSAEDLFHDRSLREREKYHQLSLFSYLNAKISFLLLLSAYQSLAYVAIGNIILELSGMFWAYWLILFSIFVFANLLGLTISGTLKSIVAIYIMVPIMLVPQLLLAGVIVKYDKMHPVVSSARYVPFVGDIMASRWAFEAMMVYQYKNNAYNKYFYPFEQRDSEISFLVYYFIPELQKQIHDWQTSGDIESAKTYATRIKNGLHYLYEITAIDIAEKESLFPLNDINNVKINTNLDIVKKDLDRRKKDLINERDAYYDMMVQKIGSEKGMQIFRETNYNSKVSDYVMNKMEIKRFKIEKNNIVPLTEPICHYPIHHMGRAQFYAPAKRIGNFYIDTLWFNIMAVWFMNIILYLGLISNFFNLIAEKYHKYRSRLKLIGKR